LITTSEHKVLIVDDEKMICDLLTVMLKKEGYECDSAENVDQALEKLAESRVSLVISDIHMPGKSGIDLLSEINQTYPDIAVIMVTGVDDRKVGIKTLEKGACAYLVKPFINNEIIINAANAIRRCELEVSNKRYQNELAGLVNERTMKLKTAELEVRKSREETIHRLAKAAEFRDNETALHTIRMGQYCYVTAKQMKLSQSFCERIRLASPLHDVGKIGISDTILLKPGKLTHEEFEIMKKHPGIGHRILSDSNSALLTLAASIAISHHEKFNGTGYPNGLTGEEIPIEGRIAAVCDVFDALTSNRVYKKAMSVEKAMEIITAERGQHFDKRIVDIFSSSMDKILLMKKKFADKPI
jgi:putative two-component system response regulator